MTVKLVTLGVSLFLGAAFSSSAFSAKIQPVYSLKNLGDHQNASGESFEKVEVKCNTGSELRYIHRSSKADSWCVNGNPADCFEDRIDAATQACSVLQTPKIVKVTLTPQQLLAQAEREKLEDELLANQQKRIELKGRQVELQKRELVLRAKSGNN